MLEAGMQNGLSPLLERLRAATGPDRELDCAIAEACDLIPNGYVRLVNDTYILAVTPNNEPVYSPPYFTHSIDDADSLRSDNVTLLVNVGRVAIVQANLISEDPTTEPLEYEFTGATEAIARTGAMLTVLAHSE